MRFCQSLLKYSQKYGAAKAAIKYKTNRQYIYRWLRRYDGTIDSLREKSRRPHHHPNQHAEQELKLIGDMRSRDPNTGLSMYYPFHAVDFAVYSLRRLIWISNRNSKFGTIRQGLFLTTADEIGYNTKDIVTYYGAADGECPRDRLNNIFNPVCGAPQACSGRDGFVPRSR